jgi:hypothetical protein
MSNVSCAAMRPESLHLRRPQQIPRQIEEMTMGVFWLEQVRLNLQTAQLSCRQCQLVSTLALLGPWRLWLATEGRDDDQ